MKENVWYFQSLTFAYQILVITLSLQKIFEDQNRVDKSFACGANCLCLQ